MASEQIVPRIYGSEIEYGVTVRTLSAQVTQLQPPDIPRLKQFLRNGARSYLDVGEHPEYATAESSTLRDLVTQEIVGEKLTTQAYVRNRDDAEDKRVVVSLHKRSTAPDGITAAGAHESYLTTINIWHGKDKDYLINVLAAHNATRTVFTGAGHPRGKMFDEEDYALAQKMHTIETLASVNTTRDRPLVNTRAKHHDGNDTRFKRFHNTCGDANISPWAIRMKFGTTSLVLRLLEHGIPADYLTLFTPVRDARTVAASKDNLTLPLYLSNGKNSSALDIQESFHDHVRVLTDSERVELPQEELAVLDDWITVIDHLRQHARTGEHIKYLERLDWYTKRDIFAKYTEGKEPTEKQYDEFRLVYDMTETGFGVKQRKPGRRFSVDMPSKEELDTARLTPPPGRAAFRGEFIERVNTTPVPKVTYDVGWGIVSHKRSIPLPPVGDYSPESIAESMDIIFRNHSVQQDDKAA